MKPRILLEPNLFSEDLETDTQAIIGKYFDIELLPDDWAWNDKFRDKTNKDYPNVRCSLNLAQRLGFKFEYANALKFMPNFRQYLVNPSTYFTDFAALYNQPDAFPLFIRPVAGFKVFSGNVYTYDSYKIEFSHHKQRGNDPFVICACANPIKIDKEYRCVFVNQEFVSGTRYMVDGLLSVDSYVPDEVVTFAKFLSQKDYFLNLWDYVIDIGIIGDRLALVEINAFETASFYGADLEKIYSSWSANL